MQQTTQAAGGSRIHTKAGSAPPTELDPAATAFFFDFDGTLAGIVDDPQAARVESRILEALRALGNASGGAVAIVSGRSIEQLDRMMHPLRLPAAGVHGIERRDAEGRFFRVDIDAEALAQLQREVSAFVTSHPGTLLEVKPGSVALHYRKAPEHASATEAFAAALAAEDDRVRVVHGKMVVEMKLAERNKADAILDFMGEPPFAGRRPLFVGDDVTDEDGFAAVDQRNGVSIKIGTSNTRAAHRLTDIAAFHDWLIGLSGRSVPPRGESV